MSDGDNWLSHGFRRAQSWFETQAALGWGVVVGLVTLLAVVYLSQGSEVVIAGYYMQGYTADLKRLQEENTHLEAQIAAAQSVDDLYRRAQELGFVRARPESIEYLVVMDYPSTPGQPNMVSPTPVPTPVRGLAGWWRGLTRGFAGWTRSTAGGGS